MTRVEFRKNNNDIHKCEVEEVLRYKTLSCSVTVTGVTKDDKFMCLLTASKAPCNAARLSFRIENRLPKPNNIYLEKITPKEAVLRWEKISANATIYGVLLGYKLTLFGMKSEENITLANDTNYVVLTNLNPKSNYTLSVRGFTKYGDGYTLLYNFVSLDRLRRPNNIHLAKITSKEAVIRWEKISSKPKINGVLLGYKLILTSRKRKLSFISANDTNHVVFPDLAPKSNYTLSIRGFTQYSDGYAVLYNFSSLDVIPAPKNIQVVILSKTSVGIQWFLVQQREEKYDKIFGYRVNVRNATHSFQIDTLSVTYSVVLRRLSPDANYSVSVFGFGNGTKGISSKWIHFKINDKLPRPSHVYLAKITSKRAVVKWERISANQKIHGVLLGYKLTLIGKTREIDFTLANHTNHVVLHDLTPRSNYTLSIRGFTQYDDGYIELFNFSSLDVIPAPKNVQIVILSKNSAGVQWTLIQQHKEKHDEIIGYRVIVRNAIHSFKVDTLSVTYSVALNHLLPEANYSVSVFGFGNGTKGISSKWIHFKINDREGPSGVSNKGGTNTDGRNFTLTIIVVLIVGVLF
ncbi:tenascin-like isoform X2 [Dendronephthya gigantea]|nr:tenascin-like isoform X2 [Dendronephthya gigantea]XP_028416726.1 tenascin-like isoform X2 [Dendronephthya gigantea]